MKAIAEMKAIAWGGYGMFVGQTTQTDTPFDTYVIDPSLESYMHATGPHGSYETCVCQDGSSVLQAV